MSSVRHGFVVWLTGLSGAGKSTIGQSVYEDLTVDMPNTVLLDGDSFREILGQDLGHDPRDRLTNAYRIARMCRYLSSQGINVVCCTMSLYPEIWEWNRENIPGYIEVYIKVSRETLFSRDPKGLYARAKKGEESNVIGMDIPFHEPVEPDLLLNNDESRPGSVEVQKSRVLEYLRVHSP